MRQNIPANGRDPATDGKNKLVAKNMDTCYGIDGIDRISLLSVKFGMRLEVQK